MKVSDVYRTLVKRQIMKDENDEGEAVAEEKAEEAGADSGSGSESLQRTIRASS